MKLLKLLLENTILDFEPNDQYIKRLENWLSNLDFAGKSPRGMKEYHKWLNFLNKNINSIKTYYKNGINDNPTAIPLSNIKATVTRWTPSDINKIEQSFSTKQLRELKLKNVTYINNSIISEKKFKQLSKEIDNLLSSLTGFHKKAILNNLQVEFVKKDIIKSTAQFSTDKDIIYIRPDRIKGLGDDYGSAKYIIVHELGHAFEKYNNVPKTIYNDSMWFTTPYSKTSNSWNGEQFAELFALSHWYNKYESKYKTQLDNFIKLMKSTIN